MTGTEDTEDTEDGGIGEYDKREPVFKEDLVTPDRVKIWEDDFQSLCITIDGEDFKEVRPHRVFPLSGKADYISFLNGDGKETVMLTRAGELDAESREKLEHALGRMYYLATITSVHSITEKMGVGQWQVQTDRGFAHFEVVDRQLIRKLAGGGLVITDADGNRFEIRDVGRLDAASRKLIESET